MTESDMAIQTAAELMREEVDPLLLIEIEKKLAKINDLSTRDELVELMRSLFECIRSMNMTTQRQYEVIIQLLRKQSQKTRKFLIWRF